MNWIIGCDFHPRYQQIAALDTETGEMIERRLNHQGDDVMKFCSSLPAGATVGHRSHLSGTVVRAPPRHPSPVDRAQTEQ